MAHELALLSDARNGLERARSLGEVKAILDIAIAARKYAEAKKLGEDAVRYAQEIVLRATRKMGEMLIENDDIKPGRPAVNVDRRDNLQALGITRDTSSKAQQIAAMPEQAFEEFLGGSTKDLSTKGLMRHVREFKSAERRASNVDPGYVIGDYDLRLGDMRPTITVDGKTIDNPDFALSGLDGQVDAIITDPPYPREYIPLYEDLSLLARRVLKPQTGVLAVMCGHIWLPEIMTLLGRHMKYRWICVYMALGLHSRVWGAYVNQGWKPILIYRHPDSVISEMNMIPLDVFRSSYQGEAEHKANHEWEQSLSGMTEMVEHLSPFGGLVMDPFLGAGTTGVACVDKKRRFVGCDIDPACVQVSRERITSRLKDGEESEA